MIFYFSEKFLQILTWNSFKNSETVLKKSKNPQIRAENNPLGPKKKKLSINQSKLIFFSLWMLQLCTKFKKTSMKDFLKNWVLENFQKFGFGTLFIYLKLTLQKNKKILWKAAEKWSLYRTNGRTDVVTDDWLDEQRQFHIANQFSKELIHKKFRYQVQIAI